MKKKLFALAFVLGSYVNALSQATSLTIDCQTPGWLSSMINYGDQQTLESIKVTGYINGTDINFIKNLNLSHNLCQVIDLENANIVGGEGKDNTIRDKMFANLNPIRKIILPNSITNFTNGSRTSCHCWVGDQFSNTSVDTLIINGSLTTITIGESWGTRCIYFPEGITEIIFACFPRATLTNVELFLPSTLEEILCIGTFDEDAIFHCNSLYPEKIQALSNPGASPVPNKGTIYVPKGTKEKYEQSIFSNLVIIEVIPVEGVSIAPEIILYLGDTVKLQEQVYPLNALNQEVEWRSSNPDVATISEEGELEAVGYGTTSITVITKDGGYTATCEVNVNEHTTGVEMVDKITIPIDKTFTLNANTLPLLKSDGKVTYDSDNSTIASVNDKGIVVAKKKGTCAITATSVDGGYTATCEVTVTQPVEALALEKHSLTLKIGETERLYAQIAPLLAGNKKVNWSSMDEEVASVDSMGTVKALAAGETWIMAVSDDNPEAKDSCQIVVPDTPAPAPNGDCATPTIMVSGNKMTFECETPDAEFTSYLTTSEEFSGGEVVIENKDITFTLTVYAIAPGYDRSKPATMKIIFKNGDMNLDGIVNLADITTLIKMIAGQK